MLEEKSVRSDEQKHSPTLEHGYRNPAIESKGLAADVKNGCKEASSARVLQKARQLST